MVYYLSGIFCVMSNTNDYLTLSVTLVLAIGSLVY